MAPRDERAGGTWMGVNGHGLFAIVANRWRDGDLAGDRSRGLLVDDVLHATGVEEAREVLRRETAANEYEGFNLVVASPERALVFVWDGELREERFDPGVHVVVNVGVDGQFEVPDDRQEVGERQTAAAENVASGVDPRPDETADEWLRRAGSVLGDHQYGACIHRDRYGTVSSSLVAVHADGRVDWQYADGPPCTADYRSVDGQI